MGRGPGGGIRRTQNTRLTAFARGLRKAPTPTERALWRQLKSQQLGGFKFRQQVVIEPGVADFACLAVGLLIELDGATHDAVEDAVRDADLAGRGYHVLRFTNVEIGANIMGVLEKILSTAQSLPVRRYSLPQPPPQVGRGLEGGEPSPSLAPSSFLAPSPLGEGVGGGNRKRQC